MQTQEKPENNTKSQPQKQEKRYRTDGGQTKSNAIELPSITLPKGGGAIKGIDQKFTVNAANGTASVSVPLPVSKARGAVPELNLSYNSGSGNGLFGLGWNLSLPSIKRKTDKNLPQYNDYAESDTYLLSEAEDLVPEYERDVNGEFVTNGNDFVVKEDSSSVSGWTIRFYKPRIEGLFARIERWTNNTTGEIKWRVISKDNVTSLYGWSSASRIADPANPKHIYEWLPEQVIDDKGNCAYYKYKAEDNAGIPNLPHTYNRYKNNTITYTNTYLEKILYGNTTPYLFGDTPLLVDTDFMFETAFDYGEYNPATPYDIIGDWDYRADAFSEYKAGFEIRTTRLCKRVLLFHHFYNDELLDTNVLVKSLDFTYSNNNNQGFTFLNAVTQKGYILYDDGTNNVYSQQSLPPLEFTYSAHNWNNEVKEISSENLLHAPVGLSKPYQFADLYNEGLSGILSEQAGGWYYKRNLGEGNFEAAHLVSPKPSLNGLGGGSLQLLDLESDGTKQIVNFSNSPQGYFEIDDDEVFQPMRYFKNLPNINLNDKNARLIDLNGDGKTDVLITEDNVFTWWESDGRQGFKDYYRTPKPTDDEEQGARVVFNDSTQSIFLADMSGDGLTDIVRIRNGEVCYWSNLGYGKFGTKVVMDNAPVFDGDRDFNPAYIKTADIDGSGTTDIIYLGKNKFTCWLNLNGNAFSTVPFEMEAFPSVYNEADISVTDLLGNGLSCIVWSSALQKDAQAPLRYVDLMNSQKPHIMVGYKNNMGLEVELEYTPSTKFYIDDKLAGNAWVTKLHFPVHCLSKVITKDKVSGHTFTNNYTYHHGYYDHAEREFRGFGRVEQTDTETFEYYTSDNGTDLDNATINQAPILTKNWYHTGAYLRDKKILEQFETEYWYNAYNKIATPVTPIEKALPPARIVPDIAANASYVNNINPIEKREALRACKSMPLRVEVFALEGTQQEQLKPILVSTHNCLIELLQPAKQNKYAVFCVKESEAITYHYERNLDDPRIAHTFNLEMDSYGNILKSASVVYPRLVPDSMLPQETKDEQAKTLITYTVNDFTNDVSNIDNYRMRLQCESKTYEVNSLAATGALLRQSAPSMPNINLYLIADFSALSTANEIPYESV